MLKADYLVGIIVLTLNLGIVQLLEVNVTGDWKEELGWEVICRWRFPSNDRLQSVRIHSDYQQFFIYRPETEGDRVGKFFRTPDTLMRVDCVMSEATRDGQCTALIEPYQPPKDHTLTCEVSGEGPWFRILSKQYDVRAYVAPSDAKLDITKQTTQTPARVTLNCTSNGLPAPNIEWKVGYQKVPAEFSGRSWNATTKLWNVWSSLSTTYEQRSLITCVPEAHTTDNKISRGNLATYTYLDQSSSSGELVSRTSLLFLLPLFQTLVRR